MPGPGNQQLRLAVVGLIAGLSLTRFMASQLAGIRAYDPVTFLSVAVILVAVGLLARYVPARRASRVDPMVSLRQE